MEKGHQHLRELVATWRSRGAGGRGRAGDDGGGGADDDEDEDDIVYNPKNLPWVSMALILLVASSTPEPGVQVRDVATSRIGAGGPREALQGGQAPAWDEVLGIPNTKEFGEVTKSMRQTRCGRPSRRRSRRAGLFRGGRGVRGRPGNVYKRKNT